MYPGIQEGLRYLPVRGCMDLRHRWCTKRLPPTPRFPRSATRERPRSIAAPWCRRNSGEESEETTVFACPGILPGGGPDRQRPEMVNRSGWIRPDPEERTVSKMHRRRGISPRRTGGTDHRSHAALPQGRKPLPRPDPGMHTTGCSAATPLRRVRRKKLIGPRPPHRDRGPIRRTPGSSPGMPVVRLHGFSAPRVLPRPSAPDLSAGGTSPPPRCAT
jgi:hypothetical protein